MNPSSLYADRLKLSLYNWYAETNPGKKMELIEDFIIRNMCMEEMRVKLLCGRADDISKFLRVY